MEAWLIRTGQYGERDDWALSGNRAGGGFSGLASLEKCTTREEVAAVVSSSYPDEKPAANRNFANQMWALCGRIQVGDLIVMPMKTTRQIAIGRCTSGYRYDENAEPNQRHQIGVRWERTDVPRTEIKQDLLYILGAFLTVCRVSRNDAAYRLEQVLLTGKDPGSRDASGTQTQSASVDVDGPEETTEVDIEDAARNSIRAWLLENVKGQALEELTVAILTAHGFVCSKTKVSGDGGIDVIAGRGILGLDAPRIVAQCKSEAGQVGSEVVQKLKGALQDGADQGLLVAYGGITKQALEQINKQTFRIRVWDIENVIDQIFAVYDHLDDDMKARIPLKRVWTLVHSSDQ